MIKLVPFFTLCLFSISTALAEFSIRPTLESSFLVRGEITTFILEASEQLDLPPSPPPSENFELEPTEAYRTRGANGVIAYQYKYRLTSYKLGTHTIPSMELSANGIQHITPPLSFTVFPSSQLEFHKIQIGDREVNYATAFFLPDRELYIGEAVPAELKVYLPYNTSKIQVIDRGIPDLKRDGLAAWRFQSNRQATQQPFFLPQGPSYAIVYRSTAQAIRSGTISIGPGNIRPVFKTQYTNSGLTRWKDIPVYLPISAITRNSLTLPPNAPKNFKGAVGQYEMNVALLNDSRTNPTDPVTAQIEISGTGNLEKLTVPVPLMKEDDWKLYPASKKQRDAERRFLFGEVEFTQILRPTSEQDSLPAFDFSYFDPSAKTYRTITSKPIPLKIKTSANPNIKEQDSATPIAPPKSKSQTPLPTNEKQRLTPAENLQGVLGLIAPPYASPLEKKPLWSYWQLIPALFAAYLLFQIYRLKVAPRVTKSPLQKRAMNELKELKQEQESSSFLKRAAEYARSFLPDSESTLKTELANLRDEHCYQQDSSTETISDTLRSELLNKLTKATKRALPLLILLCILPSPLFGQEEPVQKEPYQLAYQYAEEGDYSAAISTYFSVDATNKSADVLYNIGTCYSKINEPGLAALYLRRALLKEPGHKEAKQNLRYIEKANGSIVIQRKGTQGFLSGISRTLINNLLAFTIWGLVLSILAIIVFPHPSLKHSICEVTLIVFILLLPVFLSAKLLYPTDGNFADADSIVVVTSPITVTTLTHASNVADEVRKTPPGSIATVLEQRGLWSYLEFNHETRGWINTQHLTKLSPDAPVLKDVAPVEQTTDS